MFVSEAALLIGMGRKLEIMSAEGEVWQPEVDPSTTVDQLKKMALEHFYPSSGVSSTSEYKGKGNTPFFRWQFNFIVQGLLDFLSFLQFFRWVRVEL